MTIRTRARKARSTKGFTLIEALVLISIIGALTALSSVVLARAGRVHGTAVEAASEIKSARSLTWRLRIDAAQATRAEVSAGNTLAFHRQDNSVVRYTLHNEATVMREVSVGNQRSALDRWRFAGKLLFEPQIEISQTDDPQINSPLARIVLLRSSAASEQPSQLLLEVVARIGSARPLKDAASKRRDEQQAEAETEK